MKLIKLPIVVLVIFILVGSIWVNFKLSQYKSAYNQLKELLKREKEVYEKVSDASINAQIISMTHLGRKFSWLNIQKKRTGAVLDNLTFRRKTLLYLPSTSLCLNLD